METVVVEALMQPDPLPDLADLVRRPAWIRRAACRGEPVGTFFPTLGMPLDRPRAICSICPVRRECLAYALASDPTLTGVWGGVSHKERRVMRRTVA